jgi:hypothetical protein
VKAIVIVREVLIPGLSSAYLDSWLRGVQVYDFEAAHSREVVPNLPGYLAVVCRRGRVG